VSPISPLLLRGRSIPAILAIVILYFKELSLSLFELWVLLVNYVELSFSAYDFAISGTLL